MEKRREEAEIVTQTINQANIKLELEKAEETWRNVKENGQKLQDKELLDLYNQSYNKSTDKRK